jgi:hypothetical protein
LVHKALEKEATVATPRHPVPVLACDVEPHCRQVLKSHKVNGLKL